MTMLQWLSFVLMSTLSLGSGKWTEIRELENGHDIWKDIRILGALPLVMMDDQ